MARSRLADALLRPAPPAVVLSTIAEHWLRARAVPPALAAVTLQAHQVSAAARLLDVVEAFGGAMLADEAGLGKTYVALAVARALQAQRGGHCLIAAPASLRDMWARALRLTNGHGDIVSFEELSRGGVPAPSQYALVIVDEAHHVRNPRTRRYGALARATWGARTLLLTATPVHNRLRDLRAQFALFLGTRAFVADRAWLLRLVVRRREASAGLTSPLPQVNPLRWLPVDSAPELLRALLALPPAVPPADGGSAHALLQLGLVRAWTSSEGALRAALRRRLLRASALTQSLEAGRLPDRRELRVWAIGDDAVQLGFPELLAQREAGPDRAALLAAVSRHAEGIRSALVALNQSGDVDAQRADHLQSLLVRHPGARIVALTHFADTATTLYRRLSRNSGIALVTGRGGHIASGPVPRREIVARFAHAPSRADDPRLPLHILLATDVLSEGLDLQGASVLVHLDLPWTLARLEQRLGRLRRLGSPHHSIALYAMGTPAGRRELRAIMRTLHRKARLVESLVGFSELAAHQPLLGSRRGPGEDDREDLAGAWEAARAELHRCRGGAGSATMDGGEPIVGVATVRALREQWGALALVADGQQPHLLVVSPSGVSEDPHAVLALVRAAARSGRSSRAPACCRDVMPDLCMRLRAWLAARKGESLLAPAFDTPSTSHLHALRQLDGVMSRTARHERVSLAPDVERCRRLVLAARGAGAELALDEWLESLRRQTGAGNASPMDVGRLRGLLETRDGAHAYPASPQTEATIVAVLVLVRKK